MRTSQEKKWASEFGKEYTDRSVYTAEELDMHSLEWYGVSRTERNKYFLDGLGLESKSILEVGCNVGNQLRCLESMGYTELSGIEIQSYAVELAKTLSSSIKYIHGTGLELPFEENAFELVFTSGVLIHISPENIGQMMDEIYRCSKKYIWGFEYFGEKHEVIDYRGNNNLMWRGNFAQLYLNRFPDLELIKEKRYKYLYNENVDSMFLLRKK